MVSSASRRGTPALPGSPEKLEAMRKRVANGQRIDQPGDTHVPAWECVECGDTVKIKPERCAKCGHFTFQPAGA